MTENESATKPDPIALCNVKGTQATIISCPHCGKQHRHGTGRDTTKHAASGEELGHRVAHCLGPALAAGYFLVVK